MSTYKYRFYVGVFLNLYTKTVIFATVQGELKISYSNKFARPF